MGGEKRGDIQGLRAVAVLLVVLGHAGVSGLTGGYTGVDVFFVISGFLITGLLLREVRRTGRVSIADFYARRARRILPAASVVLVVIVLVSGQLLNYLRTEEVLTHAVWAAFFAANVYSARHGTGYFDETSFVSPVQHYWSLAVEEQFYLLWPALIALLLTHRRARRASTTRRLAIALVVLCAASLAWSIWSTSTGPAAAYYSAPARAWELGIGALLALGTDRLARMPRALRAVLSWAGLGAIAVAATAFSAATPFPGYHALLPTAGAALVLAGGGVSYGASLLLDRLPMRWIGDLSYSLYLWHWPFLVLPAVYLDRELRPLETTAVMLAALAVSALSYRYVETPVRRAKGLSRHRVKALLMWPATVAIVIGTATGVQLRYAPALAPAMEGASVPADDAAAKRKLTPAQAAIASAELARKNAPLPRALRPSLKDLWGDVAVPPKGCSADRDQVEHRICVLGDPAARRTVVLLGDSHMSMWMDPIVRAAQQRGWRVITLMKASCYPADVTMWRLDAQRPYTECDTFRRWTYDQIAKLKPDRIVVSGLISLPLANLETGGPVPEAESLGVFAAGAERALRKLRTLAPQVYAISGTTNLDKEAADCLAARKATRAACAKPLDPVVAERNTALRKAARAGYVDAVPWLCDSRTCPLVIGNVIAYRDDNHVTRTFADTVAPLLTRLLRL